MDRELLYNQSGIKDITAYKAIKNIGSGGTEDMNGCEINKGEVWEVESGVGTRLVVVVNCYEKYAATVMLQEQEPGSNGVAVKARDIMYADAGRLGYVFYDKMVDFVRVLSMEEYQALRRAIGEALGLEINKASAATTAVALEERDKARDAAQRYENEVAELTLRLEAARAEVDALRRNMAEAEETIDNQAEELEEAARRVEALEAEKANRAAGQDYIEAVDIAMLREDLVVALKEAEIYKGLYENILARALG